MKYRQQTKVLKTLKQWELDHQHLGILRCEFGYKVKKNTLTDILSFRIFVKQKLDKSDLKGSLIPEEILGIPTDVIEINTTPECETFNPHTHIPELIGGIEIKNSKLSGNKGTLGCIVWKDNEPYGLSCHHVVYGPAHNGTEGNILQPPTATQGIGKAINQVSYFDEILDCAVFKISARQIADYMSINGECGVLLNNKNPLVNDVVYKYGASTLRTSGIIVAVGTDYKFTIQKREGDPNPISTHGDSGSVWYTKEADCIKAVGLHLSGNKSDIANACSMVHIFNKMKISYIKR